MMRDKYSNKSTAGKIFHRYTGFIVFGVIVSIIAVLWWSYTSDQVFFESWQCYELATLDPETLTDIEKDRYFEIFDTSCKTWTLER